MASAAPEIPALASDHAFEALYRSYVKDVYHYALALLRNPADAEDVTQTTFMNAYRAYKRGERPIKARNWLIKIAHNAARSRYARAGRRVKEVPLDDHLDQLAVPEDEKPDVHAVLKALGRLPLNQRAALVMRELDGRTYAEIAETLGVSVAAVETLLFRGRRALRLKASTIRVLTTVPVPGSLAQLFGAGGVVGGGGVLVGSGFLLKAAVAIVAGVVATGVGGGDQTRRADAAGSSLQTLRGSGSETALAPTRTVVRARTVRAPAGPARHDRVTRATRTSRQAVALEAGNGPSSTAGDRQAGGTSTPTQPVTTTTSQVASTVGTAVDTATTSLPVSPPVAVPDLPAPPDVQLPAPPPPPPLP